MLGVDRYSAARFSFLMVVPLILGKVVYDMISGEFIIAEGELVPVAAGFIAAFITGAVACQWMIALVRKAQLKWFAIYCGAVGVVALILSL
jgi:undecaprenyl-diphosphatase